MHYYQFHIGDYRAATAHLSNEEDLAYRRLLDMYYDTEEPIPEDIQWVSRRIRIDASIIRDVLNDMFSKAENGVWRHKRVDQEIAKYKALEARNKANGSKGGRPKNPEKPSGLPVVSNTEPTGKATNNHKPITKNISMSESVPTIPFDKLIDLYEKHLPDLPAVRKSLFATGSNAKATRQRWDWVMTATHEKGPRTGQRLAETPEQALEWFDKFFGFVSQSEFLTGKDGRWTGCNLGWLMNRTNFEKVLSGQYNKKD